MSSDDDTAANRIKHDDGSYVAGPVVAPVAVWLRLCNLLPVTITDSEVNILRNQLVALNS